VNTTAQNRYGSLASRVYHLDKPTGHSFGDIELYASLLAGERDEIFEPAAGTGRVLIPLLELGLRVSGSDPSPEMMRVCAAECDRRGLTAQLTTGTFETIPQGRDFAAIIIPAGSMQLVQDPAVAQEVFCGALAALKPGGRFIFDLDPLSSFVSPDAALPNARSWADGDDLLTLTSIPETRDISRQLSVSQLRYELWRDGALIESELDRFALRFWGNNEIQLALRLAGFESVELIANYTVGSTVSAESSMITVVASKSN
jgi:SAM-dependent methyltransferase